MLNLPLIQLITVNYKYANDVKARLPNDYSLLALQGVVTFLVSQKFEHFSLI
jgi:hypothetical protein